MTNHANRGRSLETLIEYANAQYKDRGLALIQKVATPWTVIRRGKQIISAFPAEKSTVDFVGACKGYPIAFDAKQCRQDTRFPLINIEQHQLDFLSRWQHNGGRAFLLIEMSSVSKIYRIEFDEIMRYWNAAASNGPKSIPIKDFANFREVKDSGGIALDYLWLMGRK